METWLNGWAMVGIFCTGGFCGMVVEQRKSARLQEQLDNVRDNSLAAMQLAAHCGIALEKQQRKFQELRAVCRPITDAVYESLESQN